MDVGKKFIPVKQFIPFNIKQIISINGTKHYTEGTNIYTSEINIV